MEFLKNLGSNTGKKGLPALGGGALARFFDNKVVKPFVVEYRKNNPLTDPAKPGMLEMAAPLVPGFIGLAMLNKKDDAWSYAGAGMLGAVGATTAEQNFEFMRGNDQNRLADSLDDIFKKYMKK